MSSRADKIKALCVKTFLASFLISACGIRSDKTPFENLLSGNWQLNRIECYLGDELKETFSLNVGQEIFELEFLGRSFNYSVTGTCNTKSSGKYSFSFSSIKTGALSFYELLIGNSCVLQLVEDTSGETVDVPLQINTESISNLEWNREQADQLSLQHFNQFQGTTNSSSCESRCQCHGIWEKN